MGADITGSLERIRQTLEGPYGRLGRLRGGPVDFRPLRGGKLVRSRLTLLTAGMLDADRAAAEELALALELVHNASLCHDDVIDAARVRRGTDSFNRSNGNRLAVLSGDFLLTSALSRVVALGRPRLTGCFADALAAMVEGEVLQDASAGAADLSEEAYRGIVDRKTGALIRLALTGAGLLASSSPAVMRRLGQAGCLIGRAFQIQDDLLDYTGRQTGKERLADFRNRQPTLPLIVLLREASPADRQAVTELFAAGGRTSRIDRLLSRYRVVEQVERAARQASEAARTEIAHIPGEPGFRQALLELVAELAGRST